MSGSSSIEDLILAGAKRLLARAANSRSLDVAAVAVRLRASVEKYLLKDDPAPTATVLNKFLDAVPADDLCLVVACERGDAAAWNDLVEGFGPVVRSAARAASSNEEMAQDLAQSVWAELHGLRMRGDGRPAGKLAYYSGVGSLGGWLRAVVGQLAVDEHRRQARLVQPEEDSDIDRLSHDSHLEEDGAGALHSPLNPEEALARDLAAADVEKALALALRGLDAEDRLLVKLYYFDGLRLREAGAVLGVHEATASRRLARIHANVRQDVETILMKEQGWTRTEASSSLAAVAAQLQTDIEPMLAATGTVTGEVGEAGAIPAFHE